MSNFAMELLRAQGAKVSSFDICEEVPSCPGLYMIARSRALTTQTTSHDIPDDTQHGIDFGLQVPSFSRPRSTDLNSCSCQFNTCWGLPCRHMLRLYLHLKTRDAFLEGVINFFWRKLDDSTLAVKTRELLLHPCPSTLDCCTSSDKGLSPQDRYNLLSMESKSLLELGSRSDKALNVVLSCFDQAK